jgi:hypothetical protein
VPDADNAYLFVLGFSAPLGSDPAQLGLQRAAYMRANAASSTNDAFNSAAWDDDELIARRSERVRALANSCGRPHRECIGLMDEANEIGGDWLAAEPWLIERYLRLIAHQRWGEVLPLHPAAPLPSYSLIFDGQELLLLQAKTLVARGDAEGAAQLMNSDLRFWRMVLASAETIVTRMIATNALARHFEIGSLALRTSPGITPSAWLNPLTRALISMRFERRISRACAALRS